jgi:tetraacyldisaccharide 4'-kinase
VLDDAMQHRHIQPGLSILLSDYNNLYTRDFVMPAGKLREWKIGSKRADIIVVTKCPATMTPIDMRIIESEIKPENNQLLFFSTFVYDEPYAVFEDSECKKLTFNDINEQQVGILLVAGIVNPTPIIEQVSNYTKSIDSMLFDDHYAFQPKDFHAINYRFDMLSSTKKIIIVTEKDAARIVSDPSYPEALKSRTYALPIRVKILQNQESLFIQKIKNYVVENSRNR